MHCHRESEARCKVKRETAGSVTRLPLVQPRGCGSCTACCEALQVKSLDKGDWERCKHLRRGSISGCSIYKERPEDCAAYECLWRANAIEAPDFRPDKCGFILSTSLFSVHEQGTDPEGFEPYIMIHELKPGASRTPRALVVIEQIMSIALVIEIQRDGIRKVRGGPKDKVDRMVKIAADLQARGVPGYKLERNDEK